MTTASLRICVNNMSLLSPVPFPTVFSYAWYSELGDRYSVVAEAPRWRSSIGQQQSWR